MSVDSVDSDLTNGNHLYIASGNDLTLVFIRSFLLFLRIELEQKSICKIIYGYLYIRVRVGDILTVTCRKAMLYPADVFAC